MIEHLEDFKYATNIQSVYALDEKENEFLDLFRSYKTVRVYKADFINKDGEMETMSFDTEDEI